MRTYIEALEAPRFFQLRPNLTAASFQLMKLMPARFMLDRAEAEGELTTGGLIVESSSGSLGLALAMLASARNYALTLVTASSLIDERFVKRLRQLGAKVVITDDPTFSGDQQGRLAQIETILASQPNAYWPRQYDNPNNPAAYARLAEQVARQVGHIDCIVGCVGSGGSLCGTAMFLKAAFPTLHVIAVDTNGSALFGHCPSARLLRGLGNSILPQNLMHELIDEVHWVGALQAFLATRTLNTEHGAFLGPTSGAAAFVARWYANKHPNSSTVVILADEGSRYQDTVYDDDWLMRLDGWPPHQREHPIELRQVRAFGEDDWTMMKWGRRPLRDVAST